MEKDVPGSLRDLPERVGARPRTSQQGHHLQLSDLGTINHGQRVLGRALSLSGVTVGHGKTESRNCIAFIVPAGEFGHLHPFNGGSMHLVLPSAWGKHIAGLGWGEMHPLAVDGTPFLIFSPRGHDEVTVANSIVRAAYASILGLDPDTLN